MKTTYNPHAWFFRYVRTLPEYEQAYDKIIREGIVSQYSDGKTCSLSEMYEKHRRMYNRMKYDIENPTNDELNKARKRLIAVLFEWLKKEGKDANMQYVKQVACHAAKVHSFNQIPLMKLKVLYRVFGMKNTENMQEWERQLIWSAQRKQNLN
jgi:hypothetical protein